MKRDVSNCRIYRAHARLKGPTADEGELCSPAVQTRGRDGRDETRNDALGAGLLHRYRKLILFPSFPGIVETVRRIVCFAAAKVTFTRVLFIPPR